MKRKLSPEFEDGIGNKNRYFQGLFDVGECYKLLFEPGTAPELGKWPMKSVLVEHGAADGPLVKVAEERYHVSIGGTVSLYEISDTAVVGGIVSNIPEQREYRAKSRIFSLRYRDDRLSVKERNGTRRSRQARCRRFSEANKRKSKKKKEERVGRSGKEKVEPHFSPSSPVDFALRKMRRSVLSYVSDPETSKIDGMKVGSFLGKLKPVQRLPDIRVKYMIFPSVSLCKSVVAGFPSLCFGFDSICGENTTLEKRLDALGFAQIRDRVLCVTSHEELGIDVQKSQPENFVEEHWRYSNSRFVCIGIANFRVDGPGKYIFDSRAFNDLEMILDYVKCSFDRYFDG